MKANKLDIGSMSPEVIAGARATAAAIDREVASGKTLDEVLSAYDSGQRFWIEVARPFLKHQAEA